MLTAAQLQAVLAALGGPEAVDALWVFGSEADGTAAASSDVDLAVLFRTKRDPRLVYDAEGAVAAALGRDVDLVDLRGSSPILAMQALRRGVLVHEGRRSRRVEFEAGLPARYEDVVRMRAPAERALLARLHGGT